jgi:hypothetical protein
MVATQQMHDLASLANSGSTTTSFVCSSPQPFANQQLGSSWQQVQCGVNMMQGNPQLLGPTIIITMITQGEDIRYVLVRDLSFQLDS